MTRAIWPLQRRVMLAFSAFALLLAALYGLYALVFMYAVEDSFFAATLEQEAIAQQSLAAYQQAMMASGDARPITTRILPLAPFYYAEDYHQQYLEKNPEGYCGLGGIGVCLPPSLNR